jgi:uncharacterized protein YeeX (DUF496 family)
VDKLQSSLEQHASDVKDIQATVAEKASVADVDKLQSSLEQHAVDMKEVVSREMLESTLSPIASDIFSIKADMVTFGGKAVDLEDILESIKETVEEKVDTVQSALQAAVSREVLEANLSPMSADILSIKADMATFGGKAADIDDLLENLQDAVEEKVSMQALQHSVGDLRAELGERVLDIRAELGDVSTILARTNSSLDEKISQSTLGKAVAGVNHELDAVKHALTGKASRKQLEDTVTEMQVDVEERMENSDLMIELQSVRQELEEMREQWMRLGGHMNPQQRIQHVADIKMENNQLRDELMYTRKQLEASGRQLRRHGAGGNIEESLKHSPHTSPRRGRHTRGGC